LRQWMILTDLDGTLLDALTFTFEPARPMLRRLLEADVPIVPVTSKTFAEVRPLADSLGIDGPVVVESGGGIARRVGSSWRVEACGVPWKELRDAVPLIERKAEARLSLYSNMRLNEAAARSGLTGKALARSMQRQFDEPFLLEEGSIENVERAARSVGLRVHSGGRFHHLCGRNGKGDAARRVRDEIAAARGGDPLVLGLGDSPMDADFLTLADVPVIVPRPDGTPHPALVKSIPAARIAPAPGPRGWAKAVDEVWAGIVRGDHAPV
jgi:mannosyl-3-phosphoglycerate phosphatase